MLSTRKNSTPNLRRKKVRDRENFKDGLILTGDIDESIVSLLEFKKKLSALNHYYTRYRSAEELKWLFIRQLDKLYGDTQGLSLEIT